MELKVTKDRVVAAAGQCSDAARVLKQLFPEAFRQELPNGQVKVKGNGSYVIHTEKGIGLVSVRSTGNFGGQALLLNQDMNWEFETDTHGYRVLVPRVKPGRSTEAYY